MANIRVRLLQDASTFANFASIPRGIGAALASLGMLQSNDDGQAVWTASIVAITAASAVGGDTTYTYTLTSGPALRRGMTITVTGMSSGNNATSNIITLGGGTFTLNNSGVTETHAGTGTVTAATALPTVTSCTSHTVINDANAENTINWEGVYATGSDYSVNDTVTYLGNTYQCISSSGSGSNAPPTGVTPANTWWSIFHYEVWKSNDTFTSYFVRLEYGVQGTNALSIAFQFGTATNGAGAMTGTLTGVREKVTYASATGQGSAMYECLFYGGGFGGTIAGTTGNGGSFGMILWRDSISGGSPAMMGWERSMDNTGTYNSNYITYFRGAGLVQSLGTWFQCSLFLSGGTAIGIRDPSLAGIQVNTGLGTWAANGSTAVSPVYPLVGWVGNPMSLITTFHLGDFVDGSAYQSTMYGGPHTYIAVSKAWSFNCIGSGQYAGVGMRFE